MAEYDLPIEDWVCRIKNKQLLIAMCELHAVRFGCRSLMEKKNSEGASELLNLALEKKLLNQAAANLKAIQGGWEKFPLIIIMMEEEEIQNLLVIPATLYGRAEFLYEYVKRNIRELDRE